MEGSYNTSTGARCLPPAETRFACVGRRLAGGTSGAALPVLVSARRSAAAGCARGERRLRAASGGCARRAAAARGELRLRAVSCGCAR
jgi:hypothetical protein